MGRSSQIIQVGPVCYHKFAHDRAAEGDRRGEGGVRMDRGGSGGTVAGNASSHPKLEEARSNPLEGASPESVALPLHSF